MVVVNDFASAAPSTRIFEPASISENHTNPFPGLQSFTLGEEHLFFGREDQIDELIHCLYHSRFLGVLGTSGSGKSSLVQAGLLPSLHSGFLPEASANWHVATLHPGCNPIQNLAQALNDPDVFGDKGTGDESVIRTGLTESVLRRGRLGLVEVTQQARMAANENLLVVVDQLEELFRFKIQAHTTGDWMEAEDEAAAFIKLLLSAVKQREVPIFIVLTIRSEFLGECAQFRGLPEALNGSQYLIPRLEREQLQRAIEGPVVVGGAKITPRLVSCLINEFNSHPNQLPILQHALMRIWDYWEKQGTPDAPLDLEHYKAVGGIAEAFSLHADQIYESLHGERQKLAETLFRCLIVRDADDQTVSRPISLANICTVANAGLQEMIAVVNHFRQPFIISPPTTVLLDAQSVISISYESLINKWGRLQDWRKEEIHSATLNQKLTETLEEKRIEKKQSKQLEENYLWQMLMQSTKKIKNLIYPTPHRLSIPESIQDNGDRLMNNYDIDTFSYKSSLFEHEREQNNSLHSQEERISMPGVEVSKSETLQKLLNDIWNYLKAQENLISDENKAISLLEKKIKINQRWIESYETEACPLEPLISHEDEFHPDRSEYRRHCQNLGMYQHICKLRQQKVESLTSNRSRIAILLDSWRSELLTIDSSFISVDQRLSLPDQLSEKSMDDMQSRINDFGQRFKAFTAQERTTIDKLNQQLMKVTDTQSTVASL